MLSCSVMRTGSPITVPSAFDIKSIRHLSTVSGGYTAFVQTGQGKTRGCLTGGFSNPVHSWMSALHWGMMG